MDYPAPNATILGIGTASDGQPFIDIITDDRKRQLHKRITQGQRVHVDFGNPAGDWATVIIREEL
jgi:hypothetical protein